MKHEQVQSYNTMREETLAAVEGVQRVHNALVRMVEALGVAADRNELEHSLTIYHILDVAYDAITEVQKKLGALKEVMSRRMLPEGFKNCGIEHEYVGDKKFSLAQRITASFTDKEKGYEWLREIGEGALIQETVNSNTFSAFIRRKLEDEATTPPEFVKVNTMEYVKIK